MIAIEGAVAGRAKWLKKSRVRWSTVINAASKPEPVRRSKTSPSCRSATIGLAGEASLWSRVRVKSATKEDTVDGHDVPP